MANPALPTNVREVVKGMISVIDGIIQEVLSAKTRDEFVSKRLDGFRKYAPVVISLSRFARSMIEPARAELICTQVLTKAEEEFRDRGPSAFGEAVTRQVHFTIWLFTKINSLVARIAAHIEVSEALRERDTQIANSYFASGLWSAFSLDCLKKALADGIAVSPDILDEHIEGLRSAVNAYAHAREAYSMRFPAVNTRPEEIRREWDDEDEALMSFAQEPIPAGL